MNLAEIRRLHRAHLDTERIASSHGTTISEIILLAAVADAPAPISVGAVALSIGLAPATLTYMSDVSERNGNLRRRRSNVDRRSVYLEITEAGRELLRRIAGEEGAL